ncbi:hypothetical protein [Pseudomonas sp. MWU13-3659]|uniref:hypothetical protein n=1 Tax=Pseudomonas sp. MWU13-3659 TaxID=2986964 RepID=UPI0020753F9D|nr:hypothetical protein [Pseudomonas sp. MWU13-3659]
MLTRLRPASRALAAAGPAEPQQANTQGMAAQAYQQALVLRADLAQLKASGLRRSYVIQLLGHGCLPEVGRLLSRLADVQGREAFTAIQAHSLHKGLTLANSSTEAAMNLVLAEREAAEKLHDAACFVVGEVIEACCPGKRGQFEPRTFMACLAERFAARFAEPALRT